MLDCPRQTITITAEMSSAMCKVRCRHARRERNRGPAGPGCCPVFTHQGPHRFTSHHCYIACEKRRISKWSKPWWKTWALPASATHCSLTQIWILRKPLHNISIGSNLASQMKMKVSWTHTKLKLQSLSSSSISRTYGLSGHPYTEDLQVLCYAYTITTDEAQMAEQNPGVGCNCWDWSNVHLDWVSRLVIIPFFVIILTDTDSVMI